MSRLRRFLVSRKTTTTIVVLLVFFFVVASLFPQRFVTSSLKMQEWRYEHPVRAAIAERLGMDHVYTTPWFAILLFFLVCSLAVSLLEQFALASEKSRGMKSLSGLKAALSSASVEDIGTVANTFGYSKVFSGEKDVHFIKNRWGYWGSFLLHLGIFVVIASSLIIAVTQKRGAAHLVEGETFSPGDPLLAEERGILAGHFTLKDAIRLDRVSLDFWENHMIKQIYSDITIFSNGEQQMTIAVSSKLKHKGILTYQSLDFGHAFFLELKGDDGAIRRELLLIRHPQSIEKPAYEDFILTGTPYALKAKYFADAGMKSIQSENPLLILRLMDGNAMTGQSSLTIGTAAQLGTFRVSLIRVAKWTDLYFADFRGLPGVFAGFCLLLAGGLMYYFLPPRQIIVSKEENGYHIYVKAERFPEFYREEFQEIMKRLGESSSV
ncbi:MAG: cytochrome c biogenesis protein ResB [Nitrospirota bacterium]